jgi:peptide/nickel transport system permease protein
MNDIAESQASPGDTKTSIVSPSRFFSTPAGRNTKEFISSPIALTATLVLFVVLTLAIFAPIISVQNPHDLNSIDIMDARLSPGSTGWAGSYYLLGTDSQGRDMLSAILYGLRTSLLVAISSGLIALSIGVSVGLLAAYCGGRVESVLMRIVDIQLSFPAILIALVMLAVLGRGIDKVIAALVFVQWAYYARTVRGAAMAELKKEYMEAARCLALSPRLILLSHLLPNSLPPIIVVATMQIASAIAIEATLSFLGLGLPVTEPSLGLLISNGFDVMMSGYYWISIFPGIALLITVMSVNLMGDRLRDILNPRNRR